MADTPPQLSDWKELTLVGLANRLTARAASEKNPTFTDKRKNLQRSSSRIMRYLLSVMRNQSKQKAAAKGLRDLDNARIKAVEAFKNCMPDVRLAGLIPPGLTEPAGAEIILKAFCHVVLRVHATSPDAELKEVVWHSFRYVVAPQLALQLILLERAQTDPKKWPLDQSAKGGVRDYNAWRLPRSLLRAVHNGEFDQRQLQSKSPKLSLALFKDVALKNKEGADLQCAKAAILLRILLQKCSDSPELWKQAQSMADIILRQADQAQQQVHQGIGSILPTTLSALTMAEFTDLASGSVNAALGKRNEQLDRSLNLPLTRRKILSYTPFVTDPSSAELDADFTAAAKMLRQRIKLTTEDEGARTCLGYAYYMSRRCVITNEPLNEGDDQMTNEAAELTHELLLTAYKAGAPATRQIALRYLAGFSTNPRFRCTALTQKEAHQWVVKYAEISKHGMVKLFQGRLAYINGDDKTAKKLYSEMFIRIIPQEYSEEGTVGRSLLEDHEAIAYLIPECYALVGILFENDSGNGADETDLQVQIRRAGTAHFGIECDWPAEAKRIKDGFEYRRSLLG